MTDEERLKVLERHVAELAEIYDAVQVIGSFVTPDGFTRCQKRGSGNWYSRQAMCAAFIQENIAEEQANRIAEKLEPPPEFS